MAYQWVRWLDDVLTAAGVPVVREGNWEDHGRPGGDFTPRGVMMHHDASPAGETSSGADVIINGRPGLEGPLAQVWIDYDGRWHLCAAGRANHAGEGQWGDCPRDQGNTYFIGIETDHTTNEEWTQEQGKWGIRGLVAICDHLGIRDNPTELRKWLCAHKEYAAGRKVDPDPLDMDRLRDVILDFDPQGGPVQTLKKHSAQHRTLVNDEWRDLRFSDNENDDTGVYAVCEGPADWFVLTCQVYAEGPPGTVFYLRPYKDGPEDDDPMYPMRTYEVPASGTLYCELTQSGDLAGDKWLRVMGKVTTHQDAAVTLTATNGQVALW